MSKRRKGTSLKIIDMATRYKEVISDPQLNTLSPLQTVLAGRLMQLLERVEVGDFPGRVKRIQKSWDQIKRSVPGLRSYMKGDKDGINAYNDIEYELEAAFHDYEAWNQILPIIDEMRKVSETRTKILKDMNAMMSADQVFELASMLLSAVGNTINDPNQFKAIALEFARIVGEDVQGSNPRRPPEGSGQIIDIRPSSMDRGQVLYTGDEGGPEFTGENPSDPISEGLPERSTQD